VTVPNLNLNVAGGAFDAGSLFSALALGAPVGRDASATEATRTRAPRGSACTPRRRDADKIFIRSFLPPTLEQACRHGPPCSDRPGPGRPDTVITWPAR
jgi:hypothetical protein